MIVFAFVVCCSILSVASQKTVSSAVTCKKNINVNDVLLLDVSKSTEEYREATNGIAKEFILWATANNGSGNVHLAVVEYSDTAQEVVAFDSWDQSTTNQAIKKLGQPHRSGSPSLEKGLKKAAALLSGRLGGRAVLIAANEISGSYESSAEQLKKDGVDIFTVRLGSGDPESAGGLAELASKKDYSTEMSDPDAFRLYTKQILYNYCTIYATEGGENVPEAGAAQKSQTEGAGVRSGGSGDMSGSDEYEGSGVAAAKWAPWTILWCIYVLLCTGI